MTRKGVRSFRYKSFLCIMKSIHSEVGKLFRCITKMKTAPKFAGVHFIFDDQFSEIVINSLALSVCS